MTMTKERPNFAQQMTDCEGCEPEGYFEALTQMDKIVLGESDPTQVMCSWHREKMNEILNRESDRQTDKRAYMGECDE